MTLVKFQPTLFNPLFNDVFNPSFSATQPAVNILQTADGFRLEVAAPGFAKEDFKVNVEKNVLTLSAQKETKNAENGETWRRREFAYNAFERSFRLPEAIDTDNVKAAFNNGILQVELAKKPELKPAVKTVAVA